MDSDLEEIDDEIFDNSDLRMDRPPFPDQCPSEIIGIESMYVCFGQRYDACPVFFASSLQTACKEAFSSAIITEVRFDNYRKLMEIWQEVFPSEGPVDFSKEKCPMLIGVMRFCEEENEELFINEYQLKKLLQNATITLEELKNELVIFKEECDRNERIRLRDIRVKTGFDSNVILQIAKYLSLNDAINAFSFDILPLLHRTQAKVQLVEPSDRLIKLILRKLNSSQVVSLRFNTEERLSNASSNLLSIFNQVMSISLINHHSIHELLFYKIPFLNITSLSLWYDYEIAFDAVRDMIIRLPERIKRFHLYSPGIFCVHYSPNQIYPASSIYFTLEYLLIDMSYFPFVSQNNCMQNYSSCLLMTIIDLILRAGVKRVCLITNRENFTNLLDINEWNKLTHSHFKLEQVTLRILGGGLNKNEIMPNLPNIQTLFGETIKFRMIFV
ncbi:unnamed protein product [Adineta steineri]|uniref:Uncharacterized protein n=1 Tax=Adineta steineri TaxID=433720 RepID=A0A813Z3W0_9BILA|nr:unnamed protein product [Adineta steineri]CAF3945367.1 unnamed protein product [Adineta steineri]